MVNYWNVKKQAISLKTPRTISSSDDITWSVIFDGSGDVDGVAAIALNAVTNFELADMAAGTIKGATTLGDPQDLTAEEVRLILNVANGATPNSTDAQLRDRATHTGTQLASTISDFDTAVASNSAVTANTAKVSNATHTGDVAGDFVLTIVNDAVTNLKLANVATETIKGRITAGVGDPEDLTASQVRTIINVADGATLNSPDATLLNRANHTGTQLASTISDFSTAVADTPAVTANTAKVSNATHTGDVTGSTTLTIADGVVSNAKLIDMPQSTIKGRITTGTGDPEDLTATQVRTVLNVANGATANNTDAFLLSRTNHTGTQLAATISDFNTAVTNNAAVTANTAKITNATHTGDVTGSTVLTITNDAVTFAKMQNLTANTLIGSVAGGDPSEITCTVAGRTLLSGVDATAQRTALGLGNSSILNTDVPNGVPSLDAGGKISSSQLPSYVDDVLEFANFTSLPITGEAGKIYVTTDNNLTFRWSGSVYIEISASLTLGTTSSTAYRGDLGQIAYNHSLVIGNPHGTAIADVSGLQSALDGKQTFDIELSAIAGLVSAADRLPYFTGVGTAALATFTSFGRSLVDDANASAAQTTLGLVIGTNVQAFDAELSAIAGLVSAVDQLPYFTGVGTAALTTLTTYGRNLIDDVDATAARSTLGLVIGTNVQAFDVELNAIAGLTSAADRLPYFTGLGTAALATFTAFGRSLVDDADATAARSTLGLVIGTNVQGFDVELNAIAGLVSAADRLPYFTGVGTAALATFTTYGRSLVDDVDAATARTTLGLGNVDNTSDLNKPVSTATQTALNLKANLSGATFTGDVIVEETSTAPVLRTSRLGTGAGSWQVSVNTSGEALEQATAYNLANSAGSTSYLYIGSNGQLSIGNTSPAAALEIAKLPGVGIPTLYLSAAPAFATTTDIALSSNAVIRGELSIRSVVNTGGIFTWSIGGTDNKAGTSGATEVMQINTSGKLLVQGVDITPEEGTFTPTLRTLNDATSGTITGLFAYKKIGKIVHISVDFSVSTLPATGSGVIRLDGLPFVSANLVASRFFGGNVNYQSSFTGLTGRLVFMHPVNTSYLLFYDQQPNSPSATSLANMLTGSRFVFSYTYFVN